MWIIPSSALHRCSALSSSSRLVTFGLSTQSCLFHTGLISCPELTNLLWSVLHSTMKVYLHVKQHATYLLLISTWSQIQPGCGTQPGYHSVLPTKPFLLWKPHFALELFPCKNLGMDPLKWANTCQEERGTISLCRDVTDPTTPETCESSCCQTTSGIGAGGCV